MPHKVHPKVFRIKGLADWQSRGFYRDPSKTLKEDFEIRKFLNQKIGKMGTEKIEIERYPGKLVIIIFNARPGLIIGRGGEGIEQMKKALEQKVFLKEKPKELKIEIREVQNPWTSAVLIGQFMAQQIEKRMPFRKVLKQAIAKAIANKEIQGIKVEVSGRLNGNEIARREWLKQGRLPLQTIRSDIDFAKEEAHCTYGVIGVKVWLYKGEKFD